MKKMRFRLTNNLMERIKVFNDMQRFISGEIYSSDTSDDYMIVEIKIETR